MGQRVPAVPVSTAPPTPLPMEPFLPGGASSFRHTGMTVPLLPPPPPTSTHRQRDQPAETAASWAQVHLPSAKAAQKGKMVHGVAGRHGLLLLLPFSCPESSCNVIPSCPVAICNAVSSRRSLGGSPLSAACPHTYMSTHNLLAYKVRKEFLSSKEMNRERHCFL